MEIPTNITINVQVTLTDNASSVNWLQISHILYDHRVDIIIALAVLVVGGIIIGLTIWALLRLKAKLAEKRASACFETIQHKANEVTASGGLAAVGVGCSRTSHLAIDKAKTRGRTELAHIMETKVESLNQDFSEELGTADDTELNKLFSAASRQIAAQVLRGAVPEVLKYNTMDGITTAWALMVVDPSVIVTAFDDQARKLPDIYKRFRDSQAYADLVAEVEAFEAFKRQAIR